METTSRSNKTRQIVDAVRSRIEAGDFRPGQRIPSDAELVKEFDVSRPTVAKALRELEQCGLVKRRAGSGTYVLELRQSSRMFGLLIPGLGQTEIFEPICASMARIAQKSGHTIIWGANMLSDKVSNSVRLAEDLCQQYIDDKVGGVFFAPLELVDDKEAINRQIVSALVDAKIPVVLLDRDYVPYPGRSAIDLVGIDNRRVGYTITHHLFQRGCKRVIFFARPGSASTVDARIAGFIEAVVRDSGKFDASLIYRADPCDFAAVENALSQVNPDGIVCGNDVTAGRLMHSLESIGVSIPDDLLVTGIDDVRYAELFRVPLTTIRQPCAAIGDAALRVMLERLEYPDAPAHEVLLDCELITRDSTRNCN